MPTQTRRPIPKDVTADKPPVLGDVAPEADLRELDAPERPKVPTPRPTSLYQPLLKMYAMIGGAVFQFDPVCGSVLMAGAENCARSMDDLARGNPAVRRALEAMMKTTTVGAVFAAHLPVAVAILAHHNSDPRVQMAASMMQGAQSQAPE